MLAKFYLTFSSFVIGIESGLPYKGRLSTDIDFLSWLDSEESEFYIKFGSNFVIYSSSLVDSS